MLNIQINFSSGINSALLFITCATLKALNTFSHSHPTSVYITFGFWQHFVPLKMSCFLMETNLVKILFLVDVQYFPWSGKNVPYFWLFAKFVWEFVLRQIVSPMGWKIWLHWPGLDLPNCVHHHLFPRNSYSIYLYALKMPVSSSFTTKDQSISIRHMEHPHGKCNNNNRSGLYDYVKTSENHLHSV